MGGSRPYTRIFAPKTRLSKRCEATGGWLERATQVFYEPTAHSAFSGSKRPFSFPLSSLKIRICCLSELLIAWDSNVLEDMQPVYRCGGNRAAVNKIERPGRT